MAARSISGSFRIELLKQSGIVSAGRIFVLVLGVASIPVLTRLYNPEEYGLFSFYSTVITFASSVILLSYNSAIIVSKNQSDKNHLVFACLILLATGGVISIPLGVFIDITAGYEKSFLFIPIGIVIYGLTDIFSKLNSRAKRFSWVAKMDVSGNLLIKSFNLLLYPLGGIGLLVSDFIGQSIVLLVNVIKKFNHKNYKPSLRKTIKILSGYKEYPIYIMPGNLLNRLAGHLPIFIVGSYFGNTTLGNLAVAITLLNVPVTVIGGSLSTVFTTRIAELGKENVNEISNLTNSIFEKLLGLAIIPFACLMLFGDSLVVFVAGEQWRTAGEIVKIMAIYHLFHFAVNPLLNVFQVLKQERKVLHFSILSIVLNSISFGLGIYYSSFSLSIILYTISNTAISVLQGIAILNLAGLKSRGVQS
jgi:O-antigen/teichoic acid export membrane protein